MASTHFINGSFVISKVQHFVSYILHTFIYIFLWPNIIISFTIFIQWNLWFHNILFIVYVLIRIFYLSLELHFLHFSNFSGYEIFLKLNQRFTLWPDILYWRLSWNWTFNEIFEKNNENILKYFGAKIYCILIFIPFTIKS